MATPKRTVKFGGFQKKYIKENGKFSNMIVKTMKKQETMDGLTSTTHTL